MKVDAVHFLSALVVEKLHGKQWRVERPFMAKVTFDVPDVEEVLVVPEGFLTDFASVPRVPVAYLLFGDKAHRSALLHDHLYALQRDREFADAVFYAAMRAEKLNAFQRGIMWTAVRVGGWPYYLKKQETTPWPDA
jgi:hypothetical protein